MESSTKDPDWPWLRTTIFVSVLAGLLAGIAFSLPKLYGGLVLIITGVALLVGLYFNPRFRFNRAGWFVATAWLGTKSIPSATFAFVSSDTYVNGSLSQETGWLFDLSCAICIVVLFTIDYLTSSDRSPLNDVKILLPSLQSLVNYSPVKQTASQSGSGQQNFIGSVQGKGHQFHFNNYTNSGNFAAEIDVAVGYLKKQQADIAIEKLESLRRNHWDELKPREKYRTLANIGHAYDQQEQYEKGADYYIKAYDWQKEDEEAMALNAAAHFSLGDIEQAQLLVDEVLDRYPHSAIATAVRVRLSTSTNATHLATTIPNQLRTSPDVLLNQVVHALDRGEAEIAESYARKLGSVVDVPGKAEEHLSMALVAKCSLARSERIQVAEKEIKESLAEAIQLLSDLLADRIVCGSAAKPRLRYHRAIAYRLNNDFALAEADFLAATEPQSVDDTVLFDASEFLANRDKKKEALQLLERITKPRFRQFAILLRARILTDSKNEEDSTTAFSELKTLVESGNDLPESLLFEILDAAIASAPSAGKCEEADLLIEGQKDRLNEFSRLTLRATLRFKENDEESARKLCIEAVKLAGEDSSSVSIWFLARLLAALGEFNDALSILKPHVSEFSRQEKLEFVLECAFRADDDAFMLRLCEELRANARYIKAFLDTELTTLCKMNDSETALAVIDESFERINDEKFLKILRVHQSVIGLRQDRPELVESDPTRLPSAADVFPMLGYNVAIILSKGPNPLLGIEYAYDLTRRFTNNAICHRLFVLITGLGEDSVELPEFDHVELNSAVQLDLSNGKQEWKVIEETDDPNPDRDEITANSKLGKELLGKSVGDTVVLREDAIQRIEANRRHNICHL